jgi:hypothetical protein
MADLNSQQFVSQVQKTGGASMDVRSGKLLQPGQRGLMVGGVQGIPETRIPAEHFGEQHVKDAVTHIQNATKGSGIHIGAWSEGGDVVLDASEKIKRPGEAIRKAKNRGQDAVWDNKSMKEIDTR